MRTMTNEQWWQQHAYPVQSSKTEPSSSPPPERKLNYFSIPENIRAAKNAEKYHPHGRTIVVCLDGTGDKFDNDNSNIVHFVSCLKKDDKTQVTYYQAGIGTYSAHGLSTGFEAALDMAFGSLLSLHVKEAYDFLMHTYREGDKICILGFSRGAYTARCLAGMVHKVGLLPPRNNAQIHFAYDMYRDDSPEGWKQSAQFKETFCMDVSVYFLGLFDSVASVGVIPRELPLFTSSGNQCRFFRHALALDERRAKFKACRYQTKDAGPQDRKSSTPTTPADASQQCQANGFVPGHRPPNVRLRTWPHTSTDDTSWRTEVDSPEHAHEAHTRPRKHPRTDVLEVWFAGCHRSVGGGAFLNETRHKLSNIPLRWMIRQCFECDTGIIFGTKALAEQGLDLHMLWPRYTKLEVPILGPPPSLIERYESGLPPKTRRSSRLIPVTRMSKKKGAFFELQISEDDADHSNAEWLPEQIEDCFDALGPVNDPLARWTPWWILEVWPVEYEVLNESGNIWETRFGMNKARPRPVMGSEPNLHWTVKHRMTKLNYKYKAIMEKDAMWQVVA